MDGVDQFAYSYILGMYLGDGHIVTMRNGVQRIRISCCDDYPEIISECERALRAVLPTNRARRAQRVGCTEVQMYSSHFDCLFPQHGPGKKHHRRIVLADWQQAIVDLETKQFLRGLLQSDGCRCLNRVRVKGEDREYPRYFFSNRSGDILGLFTAACDRLGVDWKQNMPWSISVARRASVALLDEFVGPKS